MLIHSTECDGGITVIGYIPFTITPFIGLNGQKLSIERIEILESSDTKVIKNPRFICTKCKSPVYQPHLRCAECRNIKNLTEFVVLTGPNVVTCEDCAKRFYARFKSKKLEIGDIEL